MLWHRKSVLVDKRIWRKKYVSRWKTTIRFTSKHIEKKQRPWYLWNSKDNASYCVPMPCFIRKTILYNNAWELTEDQSTTMRISFLNKLFKAQKWQADGAREEQNHWSSPSFSSSFLPSFLPYFFITDSFFLGKKYRGWWYSNLCQQIQTIACTRARPAWKSWQIWWTRYPSLSPTLSPMLALCVSSTNVCSVYLCITPALRAISLLYVLWRLFCVFFCFFFLLQHTNSSQSQSSYDNNNSKTRNQILQSLPAVRSTATANWQQLASFKGPMKAK